jgi:short-subunit dehydrogenase
MKASPWPGRLPRTELPQWSLSPVVVITGGSSGIGRCVAALFARRGWRVGLIARGAEGLAVASRDVEAAGGRVAIGRADVADSAALSAAADAIVAALGPIDVWINCAGNGVYGRFSEVPEVEFQRVTDVTYHGTVNGTRVALAHMRPRGQGSIVNVCSAIAFHGLPLMSSYAGAKAAVRAFGQAVRGELKLERSRIRLGTVFPPAVNTPFFSHATSHMGWPARPAPPVYQPEVVAEGIWQAVISGRPEMTISGTAAVFSLAARLLPGLVARCVGRYGIERQMTRDPEACRLQEPTLFAPSPRASGVHGSFGQHARGYSTHLWLVRGLVRGRTAAARLLTAAWRDRARQPDVPSPSIPPPPDRDRELGGLGARPGAS